MTDVLIQCVGEVIGVANSCTADVSKKIAVDEVYHFTVWYHCNLGRDSWIARRRNTP